MVGALGRSATFNARLHGAASVIREGQLIITKVKIELVPFKLKLSSVLKWFLLKASTTYF